MPAHRQVWAVDLYGHPGRRDRLVLAAHRLGDREQIRFLARVVVVAEEQRDDPRRGGAEECTGSINPSEGRFQRYRAMARVRGMKTLTFFGIIWRVAEEAESQNSEQVSKLCRHSDHSGL